MADPVMPASPSRAAPVRANDLAFLRVLEATIETLKAENEILRRRLAAAEARAAQSREGGRGDRRAQGAHAAQTWAPPWRWRLRRRSGTASPGARLRRAWRYRARPHTQRQ